jgi:hypothetical protein
VKGKGICHVCLCCAVQVLEELHGSRGLLVDLPSAVRADAGECATGVRCTACTACLFTCLCLPPSLLPHHLFAFTVRVSPQALQFRFTASSSAPPITHQLLLLLPPAAAPALPNLPPYLVSAAASAPAPAAAVPASRGSRNALQYLIDGCHARLPWIRYNDKRRLTVGNL